MIAVRGPASVDPFHRAPSTSIHGRNVTPGTELSIRGLRGRVRYLGTVTNPANGRTWLDCVDRNGHLRAFNPDQVARVHRTTKTRKGAR